MSLLPYLINTELRPRRFCDNYLGFDPDDYLIADDFHRPMLRLSEYTRPWRNLSLLAKDIGSTIKTDKDKFQINLDVQHFSPEEITVKTADGFVVVEGKHEERKDDHGYVSREFKRRYALPKECNPESVESRLSSDGVLTVVAPKSSTLKGERAVPVTHTGPIRRKVREETEAKEEIKSPEKKRRR